MKVTLNKQPDSVKVPATTLKLAEFFRARSSAYPTESVYIKLDQYVYRINQVNDSNCQMLMHCRSDDSNVYFTNIHYLNVELIGTDKLQ